MDLTKTADRSLIAQQHASAGDVVVSSVIDTSALLWGEVHFDFGRLATTALSAPVVFRAETSSKASGDDDWRAQWEVGVDVAACESEAVSGTVSAGQPVVALASTTNLTAGELVFIANGTAANSEWHRIKSVAASTSITLQRNLANAQTGATVYDRAERRVVPVNLFAAVRFRLVADGSAAGQAFAVRASLVTADAVE